MRVSNVTVRKRLLIALVAGIIIFFIIDARLAYVQFFLGDELTTKAKNLWSRQIAFEPQRGEILDRNGIALATNVSAPTVYIVPRQLKDPADTAEKLAKVLEADKESVYKQIIQKEMSVRLKEGRKITHEKAKKVRALDIDGVYIGEDSKRSYPFGNYLSHVLGFAGIDNQGLIGLELEYDDELKGKKGSVQYYSDAKGQRMNDMADAYEAPVNGNDLVLTIDTKIQTIVERELDIAEQTYEPESIIALAMNPKTGEVLAMSSRPGFDPSDFQNVDSKVYNRNLPIWSSYEPGSTFKIITLAAALEEGKVDLDKDTFYDKGYAEVGGAKLKCWKRGGHGSQTFLEVVQNSCNPGFVELGERLGKDKLFNIFVILGLDRKQASIYRGSQKGYCLTWTE